MQPRCQQYRGGLLLAGVTNQQKFVDVADDLFVVCIDEDATHIRLTSFYRAHEVSLIATLSLSRFQTTFLSRHQALGAPRNHV